ncbi:hypothetical protein VNI00_010380 [Paramarasmius palmivorus]|uniref:Enamelin n=1 Tax=Paramarasmius palmivorus TaxID=297713 RepID=A0AAW0CLF3_9AGAR
MKPMFNDASRFSISGGTFSNVGRDQYNNSNNTTNHIRGSHNQYHTENHGSHNVTNNGVTYGQWGDDEDEDEWDSGEDEHEYERQQAYYPRPRGMGPQYGRGRYGPPPRPPYRPQPYPNDAFRPRMPYAATDPYYYPGPGQHPQDYYPDYEAPERPGMQPRNSAPYPDYPDPRQRQRPGPYYPEAYDERYGPPRQSQSPPPPPQAPRRQATHNPFRKAPARREDSGQQGSGSEDGLSQGGEGNEYTVPRSSDR